ncbi:NAD(P) transhydrogenase beta subunit [Teladorsagia circumcincta]|uniref:proton-translocating NAD(P)(+) transhydrogenase n=1 Tax=Teladorsagia circumcincta TaxID=45464 RepID=A0A2G9UPM1_TELCI|nr:NAD(P) transhydrogenase beta subunit [Teladorsagia circumcincta]
MAAVSNPEEQATMLESSPLVSDLPQLVAAFHSFVGLAATMTCLADFIVEHPHFLTDPSGILGSAATYLPGRHAINSGLLAGNIGALGVYMASDDFATGLGMLGTTAGLSSLMGVTLTMAIGGKASYPSLNDA